MRAIVLPRFGDPCVLALVEREKPAPGPEDVVVRVVFCGVCRHDLLTRAGAFPKISLPVILGHQVSGVVHGVGSSTSRWRVGDRVITAIYTGCGRCASCLAGEAAMCSVQRPLFLGEDYDGGYAEFVRVRADTLVAIPDGLPLDQAAAVVCTLGTAYHALATRAKLAPTETVVITGASGGVGVHAVQVAAQIGARVIAVTSQEGNRARLHELGADDVIVTEDGNFASEVKELTQRGGADVIIDITGAATLNESLHSARVGGRVVVLGNVSGAAASIGPALLILKELTMLGTKSCTATDIARVLEMLAAGDLSVVISGHYPLEKAADLHTALEQRGSGAGRLVLQVEGEP
jgi:D-arabinose 1-dehydrogenase-like Zn-dependent alcohol dehydrogenase